MEFPIHFVHKRYILNGKVGLCLAETDSGSVKLLIDGGEVWTTYNKITPIDGTTKGFIVFPLPVAA